MSLREVELMMAFGGVQLSYETMRSWFDRFDMSYAAKLKRQRPTLSDKWFRDKVFGAAKKVVLPGVAHRQSRYLNNRAENSHQPPGNESAGESASNRLSMRRLFSKCTTSWQLTSDRTTSPFCSEMPTLTAASIGDMADDHRRLTIDEVPAFPSRYPPSQRTSKLDSTCSVALYDSAVGCHINDPNTRLAGQLPLFDRS